MDNDALLHEEPIPQILSKHIFNPDTNAQDLNQNQINCTINELSEEDTILNIGDDTEITDHNQNHNNSNSNSNCNSNNNNQLTSITTTLEDIFKDTINQMKVNNKTQIDIDQCYYDFSKEISRLKISKDQTFQIRMIFDICKRQLKEKELDKIIERCKVKVDETVRAKGFNRLIKDANRRLEAHEQLENMKEKIEAEMTIPPSKKYKDQQWNEIYNERFRKYQNEKERKIQMKMEEKRKLEKKKEEEIIELCKVKKAPLNIVEEYGKRLYEDQKTKDKEKEKEKENKSHVNKIAHKASTQPEDKEIKEHKVKIDKKVIPDTLNSNVKKTIEIEPDKSNSIQMKFIEVNDEDNRIKMESIQSVNQIELLKENLKDPNTKEKSKSQEKMKDNKMQAFSLNKKDRGGKIKKLKYNDFLPNDKDNDNNNNDTKKLNDNKQPNKIVNHFFNNQAVHH